MPSIIYKNGSINSDRKIISELEELLFNGQAYLITPTKGGALTIQKELIKKSPLIGNRVLSVHELIKRLASPHKPILPRELCLLLLFEIMKKGIYKSPTIKGITPVLDVINLVNKNLLIPKISNDCINDIFNKYNRTVSESPFIDDSALTNLCLNNIKERKLKLPKSIGFIGFPRFLNSETEIIKAINENYSDTSILISSPYLPNEEIKIEANTITINQETHKAKIEIRALTSIASELRFSARTLAKNNSTTIITRSSQKGLSSFTSKLYEEGFTPLFGEKFLNSGSGLTSSAIKLLPNDDLKISEWCSALLTSVEEQTKKKTILNSELFEKIKKIKTWSDLILKDCVPKHIFIELLETIEHSFAVATKPSNTYPFNWSLFEDGIFPNTKSIINNMTVNNYPRLNFQTHPAIQDWWHHVAYKNFIVEDECLFNRLIESVPELLITYSTADASGTETHKSPFVEALECEIKNISIFPLIPVSTDYDKRLKTELFKTSKTNHPKFIGHIQSNKCHNLIKKKKGEPPSFSITELETYANCPFEYFIKFILGAKEFEEKDLALLPADRGRFAHKLLSRVLTDKSILMNGNELELHINTCLNEIENDLPEYFHKSLWRWEKKNLFGWAMNVINNAKANSALSKGPNKFVTEWSFGDEKNPPLELRLHNGEAVRLKGRVDRIDISKDNSCFSVTDYKTSSSAKVKKSEIEEATHLQLPMYMLAVETLLLNNLSPTGCFIYSLKNNELSLAFGKKFFNKLFFDSKNRTQYDDDAFEKLRNNITEKTKEYISNIFKGDFGYDKIKCNRNCRFKAICKKQKDEKGPL